MHEIEVIVVVGPLLFILYCNDFEICLNFSKGNLCAGDAEVLLPWNELGNVIKKLSG